MNKMNKKGFTLIEMLVVIAIIAVLVSIIIPTVANSTKKASAAADAANLRSVLAEVTTGYLTGNKTTANNATTISTANVTITLGTTGKPTSIAVNSTAPKSKSLSTDTYITVIYRADTDGFEVNFGGYGIADFATVAEDGTDLPTTGTAYTKKSSDVSGTYTPTTP